MIVKVQRALYPTNAPALIYNKSRTVMQTRQLSKKELQEMGEDMKAFFQARNDANEITLIKRNPDEDW